jgi:hypothetical protein
MTDAVTVHDPPAGIEPLLRVTVEEPLPPRTVPPQVVLPSAYTVNPLGNTSTRGEDREPMILLALLKVMVRVEVPPAVMLAGRKDLPSDGARTGVAVRVAAAAVVLLPLLVLRAPTARELM